MQLQHSPPTASSSWLVLALLLITGLKVYFASKLDLYSDEAFYWLASTDLSLGYSDLPFMTALLVKAGSNFTVGNAFAVRLLFLILGSSIPLLIYWIARPINGPRAARYSALYSICLPLGGFLGLLAVPDVPLVFFGLLAIGFFERALRTNGLVFWLATGVAVGCGLSTHYRFFLYPLAALLFLILFPIERQQWRNPRLYLAISIASIGLTPIILFNVGNQFSSFNFYLVERHPWEFQADGLLHILKQAALVTPLLFISLISVIFHLYRGAKKGDRSAALLLSFALTNLLTYTLFAPWADSNSTSIHWPLSGYFPLIIALPATIAELEQWGADRWTAASTRRILLSIPITGFIGTLIAIIGVSSQAYHAQLQPVVGTGILSNKMAGWKEFASFTRELLNHEYEGAKPVIITDNYYTAAQLRFFGLTDVALTLDRSKAVRDGRITQLSIWGMDSKALPRFAGRPALYINEDSTLLESDKIDLMTEMCQHSSAIRFLQFLDLFAGEKAFSFYAIDSLREKTTPAEQAKPCPYPIIAWIDSPPANGIVEGDVEISGWAYSEDIGIASIELFIDGMRVQTLDYQIARADVVEVRSVQTDPNSPNLGYGSIWDSSRHEPGTHELALRIVNNAGTEQFYGKRQIVIQRR
ncbi:MAG: hypothetical protein CMD92_04150 [Gammaproteobacteria bacterium]|nr:hypothetical protein [Gammaproteobacteria bacterium]